MSFLGVNFASRLAKSHRSVVDVITLTQVAVGALDSNPTAGRAVSSTSHQASGYLDDYTDRQIDGTMVQEGDRRVVIFAGTLADGVVPAARDTVTAGGETYTLQAVKRDPSGARYVCQARSIGGDL